MNFKYIMAILLVKTIYCDTEIRKRRDTPETKTGRFNILTGDFDDHSHEDYFPDIEYPSDILQMSRPYYFKATSDDILEPFPRDVKFTFKSLSGDNGEGASTEHKVVPTPKNKKDLLNDIRKQTDDIVKKINSAAASLVTNDNFARYNETEEETITNNSENDSVKS